MHIHPVFDYYYYYYYYYNKGVYLCMYTDIGLGGERFEAYLEIHKIYCLTIYIYTE